MGKIYVGTDVFKGGYVSVVKMKKIYVDEPMIWQSSIPITRPTSAQLNPSGTYTGSVISNGFSMTGVEYVSGTTSGTNAGTYVAYYRPDADHIWEDTGDREQVAVTLTVNAKSISGATVTLSATSKTYSGSAQSVSISSVVIDGLNATFNTSGTTSATDVGTYTVTATGTGNFTGTASANWTMNALYLTIPSLSNTTQNYSGSAKSVTVNNYNSSFENQSGTASATDGGNYTVSWTLKSTTNTKWSDNTTGTKSGSWLIQYVWNKYNSVLSYSQASQSITSDHTWMYSGLPNIYYVNYRNNWTRTWTFDSSTGKFNSTGGSVYNPEYGGYEEGGYKLGNLQVGYTFSSPSTSSSNVLPSDGYVEYIGVSPTYGYKYVTLYYGHIQTTGIFTKHYSTSTYSKGSTSYGTVANTTNSSAYPTNGRASDGYWYVKTW